jgi:tRNA(Ile)-lysidine synthetase, N-terminal domain/tRNA(Ile)-lysidine synthetase, C-terminal domain
MLEYSIPIFFMIGIIRTYIEQNSLLTCNRPVIVGFSGGADSVALLSVLSRLGYDCIAAHCNFHLRGNESQRDEDFCRSFTQSVNVPFYKIDFDTEKYAKENSVSIEMAARDLRYEWFESLRQKLEAQAIAVAHHIDDSVETVLMNLCRGTGIRGLVGIRPKKGFVVRPLLSVTRKDVLSWLSENKLSYVTDSSNSSEVYTRNYIRNKILPALLKVNPSVNVAISRTTEHLSDVEALYLHVVEDARKQIFIGELELSIEKLLDYPAQETILFELLKPYGFSRVVVLEVFQSLNKESGKVFFSPEYRLVKDRDKLLLGPVKEEEKIEFVIEESDEDFFGPLNLAFKTRDIDSSFVIEKSKSIACLDYDKLKFPLVLRKWKQGDWFIPFGMKGKKKLSDYFSDSKYSLIEKERAWLLCSGDDIVWLIGERLDNRFCITEKSKRACLIHFS